MRKKFSPLVLDWYLRDKSSVSSLLNSIQAYFKLDDASGDAIDEIANNDGTVVGATQGVTGKIGDAYSLDGINDYVNIDNVLTPLATTTEGTWAIWVEPVDATPVVNSTIISFGDTDDTTRIFMFIGTTGILDVFVMISGVIQWRVQTDAAAFSDNVSTHVTLVKPSGANEGILYIDGVEVAQTTVVSTDLDVWFNDIPALDNGRIGDRNFNSTGEGNFFEGLIDEVGFWDRVLTVAEITELYNSGTGKTHPF